MILEQGQYIYDGENNLVVCATKEIENLQYVYLVNEKTDEVGFYKITEEDDKCSFELVKDDKLIEHLIMEFSKDYLLNNPGAFEELIKLKNVETKKGE